MCSFEILWDHQRGYLVTMWIPPLILCTYLCQLFTQITMGCLNRTVYTLNKSLASRGWLKMHSSNFGTTSAPRSPHGLQTWNMWNMFGTQLSSPFEVWISQWGVGRSYGSPLREYMRQRTFYFCYFVDSMTRYAAAVIKAKSRPARY